MKNNNGKLTQEQLKRILDYNPETGIFIHKLSPNGRIKKGHIAGTSGKDTYVKIKINFTLFLAHRLAWLYIHGYFPENDIDHVNRIKNDNRIINLREASRSCNIRNASIRSDNKTGITGIYYDSKHNRWVAGITINGNSQYIGRFKTLAEAAYARWTAEKKYNFPNCCTISSSFLYLKEHDHI
jgi:hypothetical protein